MKKKVVSFLVSGQGQVFAAVARNIKSGRIKATLGILITNNPSAAVLERAKHFGVKSIYVDPRGFSNREEYDTHIGSILEKNKTDLVITAGYLRLLSPCFVDKFRNRIINIHPSLLPNFPGLHSQQKALNSGVKITGCTAHFIDKGMDAGPIIMQSPVPIFENDDIHSLSVRILKEEFRVLSESVKYFCEGNLEVVDNKVIIKK
jgi:phosphoribosylglycinamide formyltransferase-1